MSKVSVAITMGDPAGIGPEAVLGALAAPGVRRRIEPVLVGDCGVFRDAARRLGQQLDFVPVDNGSRLPRGAVRVVETSRLAARDRAPGKPTVAGAEAAYRAVVMAARMAVEPLAGIVTAPLSKAGVVAAGHRFRGHTELLARLSGAPRVRMMMAGPRLRVVLVTTHVPLRRVPALLSAASVADTIALANDSLRDHFGVRRPRLAVCGLNPHAGEGGLFGDEDERIIRPAVQRAHRRGIRASGPLSADSVFAQAAEGAYDAVVCMYHDQGLAPFKLLHFKDGVNVTLGLPFVRTSPDHGTAYDIAGKGKADASSMIAAIELAGRLGERWARQDGRSARDQVVSARRPRQGGTT
jgi:4-hydroxythreonine-4-phosphate dehydrogenase